MGRALSRVCGTVWLPLSTVDCRAGLRRGGSGSALRARSAGGSYRFSMARRLPSRRVAIAVRPRSKIMRRSSTLPLSGSGISRWTSCVRC